MAIELGVSFMVGVSCLVFSLNLVRKLREDDQYQYERWDGNVVDRMRTAARGIGGGLDGGSARKSDENVRRSGSPAVVDRGIGSLLARHPGSRLDMYDSDEHVETMAAAAEDQRDTGVYRGV